MAVDTRLISVNCHADDKQFSLTLIHDATGETITTPRAPASLGFTLALALIAAGKVDGASRLTLPVLGGYTLLQPLDAGCMLLAFYPGPLVGGGPELLSLLGL